MFGQEKVMSADTDGAASASPSTSGERFKPSVLDGLMTANQICADVDWSPRTLRRRETEGLPFLKIGQKRFYEPAAVRAWLLSQARNQNAPRRGMRRANASA
jgi:hypothetical protein